MRRTYKSALVAIVLGFVAASCGETTTATGNVDTVSANTEGGESVGGQPKGFSKEVIDLETGETVTIGDIVDGDKPVLIWSSASYCSTCQGEAPVIDDFSDKYGDKVQVIGVQITGSEESGQQFKESTQVDSPILWSADPSIISDDNLGLGSYPRFKMYSQDFTLESESQFGFNEDKVLDLLEKMSA